MIDGHGDDLHLYRGRVRYNFSSNILQDVGHSALLAHIASMPGLLSNYPEPSPLSVERMIEEIYSLPPGSVMVTSGATDAIYLIANCFRGSKSWVRKPTFSEYEDACRMYGHDFTSPGEADLRWVCLPNNPDGIVSSHFPAGKPGSVRVIDMAYADYSVVPLPSPRSLIAAPDTILLFSLTKRFSVPGIRVGYLVAHPDLTARLKHMRMPWSVGSVAIEAAKYLLGHMEDYPIDALALNCEALRMAGRFRRLGLAVTPTVCNFFLATLPAGRSAATLKEWLVDRHGLLIRDASNITGSPADFRVAAQTPAQNDLLINALEEWISL